MKRINHKISAVLVVISIITTSLLVFSFGCAKKEKQELKIGAILPLTGSSALLGELAKNGLILSEEDINKKGGINGMKLKVIFEDGMADPNASISAFKKLVALDGIKFVITTHSSVGLALVPLADKEKVILFVHASHPEITGKSLYVFRHSNMAEQESQIIVNFVREQEKKTYALAVMNDDYGMVFRDKLKKLFTENKISLKSDNFYDISETDFKTIAQKLLRNQGPDIIVIAGLGNGVGLLINRLREFGYRGDILITLGAVITGAFESAGEAKKGVLYVDFHFDAKDENYQNLNNEYFRKYQSGMQPSSVLFYNTLLLVGQAISKVGYEPSKVSEYLKGLSGFKGVGEEMEIVNHYNIVPSLQILKK